MITYQFISLSFTLRPKRRSIDSFYIDTADVLPSNGTNFPRGNETRTLRCRATVNGAIKVCSRARFSRFRHFTRAKVVDYARVLITQFRGNSDVNENG